MTRSRRPVFPVRGVRLLVVLLLLVPATAACRDLGPGKGNANRVSTVIYRVDGQGTAQVRYAAGGGNELTRVNHAKLPWQGTAHVKDRSDIVYRVVAVGAPGQDLSCTIEINGVRALSASREHKGRVSCTFVK